MADAVALIKLGTGVARGILKLWFKDRPFLEATGDGFIEIFAHKTGNLFAQRGGERQMQRIAERICENLDELMRIEFAGLADNDRQAVVLAASATLDHATFTTADVLRVDLDPSELCKILCTGHPEATAHFSRSEHELYDRLMQQASQYILDIARQLPTFTATTLEEVLRRETSLTEKADEIIQEVRRIGSRIEDPASVASRFEGDYLRAVGRNLDHLELFGVDVSATSKRYRLNVAYVSLSMEASESASTADDDDDLEIAETFAPAEALAAHRRILLRGPAGSGKTTFLQWIAVRCAARDMPGELGDLNYRVPFFVPLRKLAGSSLPPKPEQFPDFVAPLIAAEMPQSWVHRVFRDGRGVLLLDGLDELSGPARQQIMTWIEDFLITFPATIMLVTTRPHAIEPGALSRLGFTDLRIQEMTRDDVTAFVEQWHDAIAESAYDNVAKLALQDLRRRMISTLQQHRSIARLASSPLLCALLCALNRERGNNLPRDRVQLYQICVDMFLRRDVERQISLADYIELTDRQKLSLLEDMAYWMMRNGWSEVSEDECAKRFDHKLAAMGLASNSEYGYRGGQVCRLFIERSGILRQPTRGIIDFPHRSFQEYLAAAEILAQRDIGVVVKKANDAHWREVVVLAAGRARQDEAEAIVESLLVKAGQPQPIESLLLAASCADAAVGLRKDLYEIVRARLGTIVPPRTISVANELALAGELVLPHLAYREWTVQIAVSCIRTISRVGGPQALALLAEYAQDARQGVLRELLRAADRFAPEDQYGQRVLAKSRCMGFRLKSFDEKNITRLASLPRLRTLEVDFVFQSLAPISALTNLRSLTVTYVSDCRDFSPLSALASLQDLTLTIHNTGTIDLGSVATLSRLTNLTLRCAAELKLETLPLRIKHLKLTAPIPSLALAVRAAALLPDLESLTLDSSFALKPGEEISLAPLCKAEQLRRLTVFRTPAILETLKILVSFPLLEAIFVTGPWEAEAWVKELRSRLDGQWFVYLQTHLLALTRYVGPIGSGSATTSSTSLLRELETADDF